MWDIRITEIPISQIQEFCISLAGKTIAVQEGAPYDDGVRTHFHVYTESAKSESFIRKKIQELDKTRKGNDLYKMAKSHPNTPNYVLKNVFVESDKFEQIINHKRIVYQTEDFLKHNYGKWYRQYVDYVASINQERKIRKKIKKDSTIQMIQDIAEIRKDEFSLNPNSFINDVVKWHLDRELILPSKSNMERYIISIYQRYKNDTECLRTYYQIYWN